MPYECWETFARFAHSSIRQYYAIPGMSFGTYCERLTNLVSEVIGEKRRTMLDSHSTIEEKIGYLESMVSKIDILYLNLYEECSEGLRYLPDMFTITDDNNIEISSARQLKDNIVNLRTEFQNEHDRILKQHPLTIPGHKRSKRIPSRESFEIIRGKDVNLRAVYNQLTDETHPFIVLTTFEEFTQVFSGAPVRKKVIWKDANALHYFISSIHGIGTERANEGQWNQASRCFQVLDKDGNPKDFTPYYINDAGDPSFCGS